MEIEIDPSRCAIPISNRSAIVPLPSARLSSLPIVSRARNVHLLRFEGRMVIVL